MAAAADSDSDCVEISRPFSLPPNSHFTGKRKRRQHEAVLPEIIDVDDDDDGDDEDDVVILNEKDFRRKIVVNKQSFDPFSLSAMAPRQIRNVLEANTPPPLFHKPRVDLWRTLTEQYFFLAGARTLSNNIPSSNVYSYAGDKGRSKPGTEQISWEPRAFVYHDFLSKEECKSLISLGKPFMAKSKTFDPITGLATESINRTSSQAYVGQDKVVSDIEKRIAEFTSIPLENGEQLHIVHYEVGQKFEPHYDYTPGAQYYWTTGGPRAASVLMYLSDVEEGGETVFPFAKGNDGWISRLAVKPKMGDALVFWSTKSDGSLDSSSFHGGAPVIKGDKWLAVKFLRAGKYNKALDPRRAQ